MDTLIQRLISAGIRAPSGDNCQPWWFDPDPDGRIGIHVLPELARSFFDYQHHGSLISVGAVIENMRIQSLAEGYACHVDYIGAVGRERPAARLSFSPLAAQAGSSTYLHAMERRTVNRRPYLPLPLGRDRLDPLLTDPVDDVETAFIRRRSEVRKWARLVYLADRIRYSHPVIHSEVFSKIRLSRKQAEREQSGLEIDRLGAGPLAAPLMWLLTPWPRMQQLRRLGVDRLLARHTQLMTHASGALCLVSIRDNSPDQWIRAGEQIERLWIRAEADGLCVHPVTVALYLDQRYQDNHLEGFEASHAPLLEAIHNGLRQLHPNGVGTMLFRIGHGLRMSRPAIRRPATAFYDQNRI